MKTDVKNTGVQVIVTPGQKKIVVSKDEISEIIWEKNKQPKRFTSADLWNIRRNARRSSAHRNSW